MLWSRSRYTGYRSRVVYKILTVYSALQVCQPSHDKEHILGAVLCSITSMSELECTDVWQNTADDGCTVHTHTRGLSSARPSVPAQPVYTHKNHPSMKEPSLQQSTLSASASLHKVAFAGWERLSSFMFCLNSVCLKLHLPVFVHSEVNLLLYLCFHNKS